MYSGLPVRQAYGEVQSVAFILLREDCEKGHFQCHCGALLSSKKPSVSQSGRRVSQRPGKGSKGKQQPKSSQSPPFETFSGFT